MGVSKTLKWYAPKGQKLIAQGSALGVRIENNRTPCKGKSIDNERFCPYRALCLVFNQKSKMTLMTNDLNDTL